MDLALFQKEIKLFQRTKKASKRKRIFEIDLLRFILIVLMILDHFAYDLGQFAPNLFIVSLAPAKLYNFHLWAIQYWDTTWRINLRYSVIALFFLILGLSSSLSRNSLKRGGLILGFAGYLSIATFYLSLLFNDDMYIIFGVVAGLGLSLIIYSLLKFLFLKLIPPLQWKWFALFFGLLIISVGYYFRVQVAQMPLTKENFWMLFHGRFSEIKPTFKFINGQAVPITYSLKEKGRIIIGKLWIGADWGALFPYMGYAFLGGFLGELLYKDKKSLIFPKKEKHVVEKIFSPLTYIGSKTLYIYIFHQVVLAVFVFLLFYFTGVPLK